MVFPQVYPTMTIVQQVLTHPHVWLIGGKRPLILNTSLILKTIEGPLVFWGPHMRGEGILSGIPLWEGIRKKITQRYKRPSTHQSSFKCNGSKIVAYSGIVVSFMRMSISDACSRMSGWCWGIPWTAWTTAARCYCLNCWKWQDVVWRAFVWYGVDSADEIRSVRSHSN